MDGARVAGGGGRVMAGPGGLSGPAVSRFAPAPTGFLHLGHVVNAIYVWGLTRAAGGRVLLRIEDHDRQRSREEFERAILDDLDWIGFEPDEPSTSAFRAGPCPGRQRDRDAVYEAALTRLRSRDLIYACACTRRELGAAPVHEEIRYPGTCAGRALAEGHGAGLRVRLEPSVERFVDLLPADGTLIGCIEDEGSRGLLTYAAGRGRPVIAYGEGASTSGHGPQWLEARAISRNQNGGFSFTAQIAPAFLSRSMSGSP